MKSECGSECQNDIFLYDMIVSALMMIFSIVISYYFAKKHLDYYNNPYFQNKIIGFYLHSLSFLIYF